MNQRQLAQTVRYGRKITFLIAGGTEITGYLAGMDPDYFYVLAPEHEAFSRWVVNRSGNPAFRMHERSTYEQEPQHAEMDKIIGPFRSAMTNQVIRRGNGNTAAPRKAG